MAFLLMNGATNLKHGSQKPQTPTVITKSQGTLLKILMYIIIEQKIWSRCPVPYTN